MCREANPRTNPRLTGQPVHAEQREKEDVMKEHAKKVHLTCSASRSLFCNVIL